MAQAAAGRLAPPRERTVTLPQGIPKLTLGWGAIAWVTDNLRQPNGPLAGQPFRMTEGQVRFTLWFYAL
ncbi:Terminase, partial [human gut metagenome]